MRVFTGRGLALRFSPPANIFICYHPDLDKRQVVEYSHGRVCRRAPIATVSSPTPCRRSSGRQSRMEISITIIRRWFDYTGMTIEETKDWGWKSVLHPDDLQNCIECWTKAFTTSSDYEVEYRFKRASDGVYRWHIGRAFPLRNENGEIIQWVGTCTDIDDQKRARDELEKRVAERSMELAGAREKLQAVLDAATEVSIIAVDTGVLITVFNHGAERMLGYAAEEMVGKQSPLIIHLESETIARSRELTEEIGKPVQGFDVFVEKARDGQREEREWTFVRKDGQTTRVNLAVTASYDANGAIMGFLWVATDITERHQSREDFARSSASLFLIWQTTRYSFETSRIGSPTGIRAPKGCMAGAKRRRSGR